MCEGGRGREREAVARSEGRDLGKVGAVVAGEGALEAAESAHGKSKGLEKEGGASGPAAGALEAGVKARKKGDGRLSEGSSSGICGNLKKLEGYALEPADVTFTGVPRPDSSPHVPASVDHDPDAPIGGCADKEVVVDEGPPRNNTAVGVRVGEGINPPCEVGEEGSCRISASEVTTVKGGDEGGKGGEEGSAEVVDEGDLAKRAMEFFDLNLLASVGRKIRDEGADAAKKFFALLLPDAVKDMIKILAFLRQRMPSVRLRGSHTGRTERRHVVYKEPVFTLYHEPPLVVWSDRTGPVEFGDIDDHRLRARRSGCDLKAGYEYGV
ncbi:hypothetical protein DFH07DRAFT_768543, partial [Mycena maculata]